MRKEKPTIYYHVVAWTLFITYEIVLSAAIRGFYNHFWDYLFRYPLYIILFYAHCYLVLGENPLRKFSDYSKLSFYLLLEMALYYVINVLINEYLISSGVPVNIKDTFSWFFVLGTLFRFIYITGLSTAFRIALNLLKTQKRNLEYINETLTHEKEKEILQTQLLSAKLSLLRSQVNPHFLFNSLNSLYNRIRKNDPNSAMYVMALADLMRYALQETTSDEVPVESELDYISNYLKLQSMRYSTEVDISIKVDEPDLKIAALLLINIVENVFKHGDLKNADCRPFIRIIVSNGELLLETKNYIRPDHSPGNGVGLINVRKRLEYQYKDRFEFDYAAKGKIFNVKLFIKLR